MLLSCFDIALSTITWMQHIPFRVFLWYPKENPNWNRTNTVVNMQHCLWVTRIQRWVFFLLICHFIMFHVPEAIPQTPPHSSSPLNSPLDWKASLRLSSTSANHRTSFTSFITYSGSTPGAPTSRDDSPMLLRGFGFLELRPMSKVLADPADRDPVRGLERCRGRPWVCFVPLPPLLLLLFRSIPAAASAAATLYRGNSPGPWKAVQRQAEGDVCDCESVCKYVCVWVVGCGVGGPLFKPMNLYCNCRKVLCSMMSLFLQKKKVNITRWVYSKHNCQLLPEDISCL